MKSWIRFISEIDNLQMKKWYENNKEIIFHFLTAIYILVMFSLFFNNFNAVLVLNKHYGRPLAFYGGHEGLKITPVDGEILCNNPQDLSHIFDFIPLLYFCLGIIFCIYFLNKRKKDLNNMLNIGIIILYTLLFHMLGLFMLSFLTILCNNGLVLFQYNVDWSGISVTPLVTRFEEIQPKQSPN